MTVKARMLKLLEQRENELISGEAAAAELNCTRAAIWKAVKSLREEGYTIEAGPNKGYVLRGGSRLSEEGIRLYLDHPDVPVKIYRELDSTNRAAKEAAFSGEAGHGALILARRQKSGRGRRGRSFYSPENAGLYMSIVLRPDRTLKEGLLITTAAATAVCRAVKKICGIDLGIIRSSSRFRRRAAATTLAPSMANSRAVERPMPELAPVTMTTLPSKRIFSMVFVLLMKRNV